MNRFILKACIDFVKSIHVTLAFSIESKFLFVFCKLLGIAEKYPKHKSYPYPDNTPTPKNVNDFNRCKKCPQKRLQLKRLLELCALDTHLYLGKCQGLIIEIIFIIYHYHLGLIPAYNNKYQYNTEEIMKWRIKLYCSLISKLW